MTQLQLKTAQQEQNSAGVPDNEETRSQVHQSLRKQALGMADLPQELLGQIMQYLSTRDLLSELKISRSQLQTGHHF